MTVLQPCFSCGVLVVSATWLVNVTELRGMTSYSEGVLRCEQKLATKRTAVTLCSCIMVSFISWNLSLYRYVVWLAGDRSDRDWNSDMTIQCLKSMDFALWRRKPTFCNIRTIRTWTPLMPTGARTYYAQDLFARLRKMTFAKEGLCLRRTVGLIHRGRIYGYFCVQYESIKTAHDLFWIQIIFWSFCISQISRDRYMLHPHKYRVRLLGELSKGVLLKIQTTSLWWRCSCWSDECCAIQVLTFPLLLGMSQYAFLERLQPKSHIAWRGSCKSLNDRW